jgi:hypothetical protein
MAAAPGDDHRLVHVHPGCEHRQHRPAEDPRATGLVNVGQRITGAISTAMLASLVVLGLWAGAPSGTSIADGTASLSDMRSAFGDVFIFMTLMSIAGVVLGLFVRDRTLEQKRQ